MALLVSVGGNAAAALIITKNNQIGAGTVAGHHPPLGDHANIIAGSIAGHDLAPLPKWHAVGAPGEPPFLTVGSTPWSNSDVAADLTKVAFYQFNGRVFLEGAACLVIGNNACGGVNGPGDRPIFTLPPSYRPKHTVVFSVPIGPYGTDRGTVYIQSATGNVVARDFNETSLWLDGISYRIND
jgi:hypothetical protein